MDHNSSFIQELRGVDSDQLLSVMGGGMEMMGIINGIILARFRVYIQDFRDTAIQHIDSLLDDVVNVCKGKELKDKKTQLKQLKHQIKTMEDIGIFQAIFLEHILPTLKGKYMKVGLTKGLKLSGLNRRSKRDLVSTMEFSPFEKIRTEVKKIEDYIAGVSRIQADKHNNPYSGNQVGKLEKGAEVPTTFNQLILEAQHMDADRSRENRIQRMHTRLLNILQGTIAQRHIDEVTIMKNRIQQMEGPNDSLVVGLVEQVTQLANGILEAGVDTIETKGGFITVASREPDTVKKPSPDNNRYIDYLRFIRVEVLTYKLSSKKRGESIGDGNFIAHVWRPFLALFEYGLKSEKIDAQLFSWKELVNSIYTNHNGINSRVRLQAFLDKLSKTNHSNGNLFQNWAILLDVIQEFSVDTGFYKKESGVTPLSNFLETLKNNPPPSR